MSAQRPRASEWRDLLLDPGALEVAADLQSDDPLDWPGYAEARRQAPGDEGVRVWRGSCGEHPCVLIAFDFAHLAGSMSAGVGARVAAGFDDARDHRLPVVTVASSGGSRMQEGMIALSQMARTTVAAARHAQAGLLSIGIAADPTTGGVYASFLSQADLLVAVEGAYVGFAGPRVAASLGDGPPPPGTNTAEFALDNGLVDGVIARDDLRGWISTALAVVAPGAAPPGRPVEELRTTGLTDAPSAWDAVQRARSPQRPRASDLVARMDGVLAVRGDRAGGRDDGVIACLARLRGVAAAVVGLDRRHVSPAGYRTAVRVFAIAERLDLPLVTLVDTPGAHPGPVAEAAGQANAISTTLAKMLQLRVPTVAVVIGEGGSGGAMALAAGDALLIQEHAIFSVIAPEGAAAILHRDKGKAPDVAAHLKLTARDLVGLKIADEVAPEGPEELLDAIARRVVRLHSEDAEVRLQRRLLRWGTAGGSFVMHAGPG